MTVVGVLRGVESGQVGERRLALPLVQADKLQLWQPRPLYVPAPDPWYRPYPFGFYPPGYLHPYDYYDPFWWPYPYRGPQLYRPLAPDKLP